jgi:succinate dehydrogenase/fumarate reductase flavoprotein subunit
MVEVYVRDAPVRVRELLDWGMKVDSERSCGRAIITTGMEILRTLRGQVKKAQIQPLESFMVTDLLMREGVVCGAMGVDIRRGEIVCIRCKAVILATGGWHELFAFNTGSDELTGDGPAMAFRAGAVLTNMEMVTYCPNIILDPPAYRASVFLYNFLPGKLLNSRGDEFLLWENPAILYLAQTSEWNKLILSRASWSEIKAGRGSPHGGVFYSLSHVPEVIWTQLVGSRRWKNGWRFQGKDFSPIIDQLRMGDAIEVAPAAHYFEGGIKVNANGETTLPGLFAAGECSGGLFGANRVSAATTEMLVQGVVAGRAAALYASKSRAPEPSKVQKEEIAEALVQPLFRTSGNRAIEVKRSLQEVAYRSLGPLREQRGLQHAFEEAGQFKEALSHLSAPSRREHNRAWIDAIETRNLCTLLCILAASALERKESRGVHIRSDFPKVDNVNWLRNVLVCQGGQDLKVESEPIVTTSFTPERAVLSYDRSILDALGAERE